MCKVCVFLQVSVLSVSQIFVIGFHWGFTVKKKIFVHRVDILYGFTRVCGGVLYAKMSQRTRQNKPNAIMYLLTLFFPRARIFLHIAVAAAGGVWWSQAKACQRTYIGRYSGLFSFRRRNVLRMPDAKTFFLLFSAALCTCQQPIADVSKLAT